MPYPQDVDRETFLALPAEQQDSWWVQAAADDGADLIVSAVLNFRTQVRTDINSAFWLNLPLFLLGGPMTWFVNDRSYFLEAQLTAEVHAVDPLAKQLASLADGRSRLQSVRSSAGEVPLDFLDRADHGGQYLLSVIVPSGLLATDTEEWVDFEEREVVSGDSRRDEYYRYAFVFQLPDGDALPEYARLELVDGSSNGFRRTYLLPVKALAGGGGQ